MTASRSNDPFAGMRDEFAKPGALTPPGATPIVRTLALEKYFGTNHVLRGVNLDVYPRETICLIGRSGSGKSTLLRCINFLEEPRWCSRSSTCSRTSG